MGFQYSRIWNEIPITDQLRACLLESPSQLIVTSATSNVMREPGCIVLLDHKYPIIGLMDVSIERSRTTSANTAKVSFENIQNRYSGPNKQKVTSNTFISIYMGYSKNYMQRFEGYIDTLEMDTNGNRSVITLSCRDRAKDFIELELSAGIYAIDSDYFGYEDWHYNIGINRINGTQERLPRAWLISEVFRDICYHMELRDIVDYVMVEEVEQPTGLLTYNRRVEFRPQYRIEIDPAADRYIKCNFVEENALDILAQIGQAILHEVLFEADGTLVIRPIKTAKDPTSFYYKEERDIISFRNSINDDDVTNAITIIGQTQNEVCVTYPFGPVAVAEGVTLDKGQDKYGWTMEYPRMVADENVMTLKHPSLYAHVIAPGGQPAIDPDTGLPAPKLNPENNPKFDVRVHYPNFSQGYDKQECLTASCPIITDEANKADVNNMRTWNYYGALDEAVSYERMPITLLDRFNKPVLVVCKERSMDDARISLFGDEPYNPAMQNDDDDEDAEPINIPSDVNGIKFSVDTDGLYTNEDLDRIPIVMVPGPTGSGSSTAKVPTINPPPNYDGIPVAGLNAVYLVGYDKLDGEKVPDDAIPFMPEGMLPDMTLDKMVRIVQTNVYKGTSDYIPAVPDWMYDQYSISTYMDYCTMFHITKTVTTQDYLLADGVTVQTCLPSPIDFNDFDDCVPLDFTTDVSSYYSGCEIGIPAYAQGTTGTDTLIIKDLDLYPMGATPVNPPVTGSVTIQYPLVFYGTQLGLMGDISWTTGLVTDEVEGILRDIDASKDRMLLAYTIVIDPTFIAKGGADVNSIYWKWHGPFDKRPTPSKRGADAQALSSKDAADGYKLQGADWEDNERVQIPRDEFYKLASDPNTVVLEITTGGVDHKSWGEVIKLDEYRLIVKGHNQYGSMADEWRELLETLRNWIIALCALLIAIALCFYMIPPPSSGAGAGSKATSKATAFKLGIAALLIALLWILMQPDKNLGAQVSKVMEDLSAKVTGKRKEEIHLSHNAIQAAQWYIREDDGTDTGQTMEHMTFGYIETSALATAYQPNYQQKGTAATSTMRDYSWVFIMDLTKRGVSGTNFPNGCFLTSIGWETPEIGDRNPVTYYSKGKERTEIITRFAIEAFGDDERDPLYTAESLMGLRFENNPTIGIVPGPAELWYSSGGYELLVDRSMTDNQVSDNGFWFDFFERRETYVERRYKFVALVVFSWHVKKYDVDGNLVLDEEYIQKDSTPDPTLIFAHNDYDHEAPHDPVTNEPIPTGIQLPCRWGLYVPRGLNPQYYDRFRWVEKDPDTGISKLEQNYAHVDVQWRGQEKLIAHLLNNFRYSVVTIDFRVWGKAYGKYAPTLVYYKNVDILSVGTHGYRELRLVNNLINDYDVARKLANMLTAQSNETYQMETTGKPYVFEGNVVMVKEETSGALSGNFRTWEMSWFAPEVRNCVQPANKLNNVALTGMFAPQCALATYGNNTLIGCSDGTKPAYLIEVDKASNPIWYANTTNNQQPMFLLRWTGINHIYLGGGQVFTYVGLRSGIIHKLDYAIANVIETVTLPAAINCGCMAEEQQYIFVGTTDGLSCIDVMDGHSRIFDIPMGEVTGVSNVNYQIYDKFYKEYRYLDYGIVFVVGLAGIRAYKSFSDYYRTDLGPLIASYAPDGTVTSIAADGTVTTKTLPALPITNPGSLWYDKSLDELLYVNKSSATRPASMHGIRVEVNLDPAYPEAGFDVEFVDIEWELDYMEDAELIHILPDDASRATYINSFFQPIQASRDVNKDVLYVDASRPEGKVSRMSPNGKFYITKIGDRFTWANEEISYKQNVEMVTIAAAGSLQLTNFGKNFLNTNTQQVIDANTTTSMARIVSPLPRDKYLIKLLTSDTIAEAINNTNDTLIVNETVLAMFGYNGDTSGVATIIAKLALNDWGLEAGEPYVYIDATTIDVTKYGELVKSQGGGSADLSTITAWVRRLESNVKMLGGLHGLRL